MTAGQDRAVLLFHFLRPFGGGKTVQNNTGEIPQKERLYMGEKYYIFVGHAEGQFEIQNGPKKGEKQGYCHMPKVNVAHPGIINE